MKIKGLLLILTGTAILLSSCDQKITGNADLNTKFDSLSYAIGADLGSNLNNAKLEELNYDAFVKGLIDGFESKNMDIKKEEIKPYVNAYFIDLQKKKVTANLEEGKAFLEKNKSKKGIITTESGLQYEVLKEGTGKSPIATDNIVCHYHGTLLDGTVFDSSIDKGKPLETALDRVIPAWTEGVQLMKEGAKYKFYIPTELAYGVRGTRGVIQPNMVIIFEIELIEVKAPETKKN
jgi:FKBP-type peptidyl-prolyl cis-trans isomerase